jgi:translation initiation factor 2 subunit 3
MKLKMFVARSFDINKPGSKIDKMTGAILGGSISQGEVKIGDEIEIYPEKLKTKVISLSTSKGKLERAKQGGLIAIGTLLDPSIAQNDQLRGKIVAEKDSLPEASKQLKTKIEMFKRKVDIKGIEIKVNDPLVLTIGTNTNIGVVSQVKKNELEINLKNPEVVEKGEKIAISKNIENQWRLVAFGEIM